MLSTRVRSISITAFPSWIGRKPRRGWFTVMLQYIDEAGKRIARDIEINEAELPRVLLAQQALIRREED